MREVEYLIAYQIPILRSVKDPNVGRPLIYKTEIEFFYRSLEIAKKRAESLENISFVKKDSIKIARYISRSVTPEMGGYTARLLLPDGDYEKMDVHYYLSAYL